MAEYLLEQYKEKVWKQEGRLSLHAILGEATNLENNKVQLPIGTLTVDELLTLLVSIHSQDTDSIRSQDGNRALPLHIACRANAPIKVLRFFVEQDAATLYMMDSAGSLPIHDACRGGASLEKIKFLVEKGGVGTLCARDNQCALPLHVLCQSKPSVDVVKYMLKLYPISVSEKTSAWSFAFHVGVRVVGIGKRASGIVDGASRSFGHDENVLQSHFVTSVKRGTDLWMPLCNVSSNTTMQSQYTTSKNRIGLNYNTVLLLYWPTPNPYLN